MKIPLNPNRRELYEKRAVVRATQYQVIMESILALLLTFTTEEPGA